MNPLKEEPSMAEENKTSLKQQEQQRQEKEKAKYENTKRIPDEQNKLTDQLNQRK
jgi:hypothetical protein